MANPKFGLPKLPDQTGKTFSRRHFLEGDIRTYYGPGQPPDAGQPKLYKSPTDWPPAGGLLRVPQVVNLTVAVPYPYRIPPALTPTLLYSDPFLLSITSQKIIQYSSFTREVTVSIWDGTPVPAGSIETAIQGTIYSNGAIRLFAVSTNGSGVDTILGNALVVAGSSQGGGGWYGAYQQQLTNPFPAERTRLLGVFADVKAKLQRLRPGLTWANVIDPWAPYVDKPPPGNAFDPWSDYGNPTPPIPTGGGNFAHFEWQANYFRDYPGYYWPEIAPADKGEYFGLNFLHVYAGTPATTEQIVQDGAKFNDITPANLARARTLPLIKAAKPKFRNCSIRYFGLNLPIGTLPAAPTQTVALQPASNVFLGETLVSGEATSVYFGTDDSSDPGAIYVTWGVPSPSVASQQAFVDGLRTANQSSVNFLNTYNTQWPQSLREMLQQDATTLKDAKIDVSYVGATSLIDADYLFKLIASYYGFNPGTGIDL